MLTEMKSAAPGVDDLATFTYRSIRQMILDGGLSSSRWVSHRTIAKQLGIGRSPVRDALHKLEGEGLLVQQGRRGVMLRQISPKELAEVYELRLVMEPFAAERAALLADLYQLANLTRLSEEMTAIASRGDVAEWLAEGCNRRQVAQLDMEFHMTILDAAGNSVAKRFFGNAQVLGLTFFGSLHFGSAESFAKGIRKTAAEHAAIVQAFHDRDPVAAREAMRQHVVGGVIASQRRVRAEAECVEQAAATCEATVERSSS